MKTSIFAIVSIVLLFGCKQKPERLEPNFYKNLFTEEILSKSEFEKFRNDLLASFLDSNYIKENLLDTMKIKGYVNSVQNNVHLTLHAYRLIVTNDSIIQPFRYDIRVGNEYIVRACSYEKIGWEVPAKKFHTMTGDSILIGGKQDKPTFINLWFISCPGCIAEIPALNRLQEKYADKVNFIAMTFEKEKDVWNFLKKKDFNFQHVANAADFIKEIGTKPYPESIFISKDGRIRYVEGVLSHNADIDSVLQHFESLIEKLLGE